MLIKGINTFGDEVFISPLKIIAMLPDRDSKTDMFLKLDGEQETKLTFPSEALRKQAIQDMELWIRRLSM